MSLNVEETPKRPVGRPQKTFTDEEVKHIKVLAQAGCTFKEIGAMMDCDQDTVSKHFSELILQQREVGKANIRYWQYKRAKEGSDKMLLHVSKHKLGEHEKVNHTLEHSGNMEVSARAADLIQNIKGLKQEWEPKP